MLCQLSTIHQLLCTAIVQIPKIDREDCLMAIRRIINRDHRYSDSPLRTPLGFDQLICELGLEPTPMPIAA